MKTTLPPYSFVSFHLRACLLSSRVLLHAVLVQTLWLAAACSSSEAPFSTITGAATACMVDEDGDGYGLGCSLGDDCDDQDPKVDTQCRACATPNDGCECEAGTGPIECFTQTLTDHDSLLCKQGQRYCRDGAWTACEGAHVFEVPGEQARASILDRALVSDAGTQSCSPCRPGCFPITDDLAPSDGPLTASNSSGTQYAPGGGISLRVDDPGNTQVINSDSPCTQMGALPDADCDGIPDSADAVTGPNTDYGTRNGTLFMDLVPGESEEATVVLPVQLRSADVYFLLDGSESMAGVASPLANAMTTGNYMSSGVTCADTDRDGTPNDELKTQGIAGNLTCLLSDAQLGAGWVREIPFLGPDADGVTYGDTDERMFEQRVDMGGSAQAVSSALAAFGTDPNYGGGDAQMQGLRLLATGQEAYVGWDRSAVPARIGCTPGTFGYPCFRSSALPIVVLMSAEPMHAGPSTSSGELGDGVPNAYPTSIHTQQVNAGTHPHYLPVAKDNEAYDSSFDTTTQALASGPLGSITNDFVTFTGNTEGMSSDLDAAQLGCPDLEATGADAVFRFNLSQRKTVTLSTAGSRFDSVLGIVRADTPVTNGATVTRDFDFTTPAAGDGTPNELGSLPQGVSAVIRGNSAGAVANYPREVLGCYEQASFSAPTDSTDYAPDVAFKFNVDADMDLTFQVPPDGSVKSLALFQGQPNQGDMDIIVPANDERFSVDADVSQNALRLISGTVGTGATRAGQNLSTLGLNADLPANLFVTAGCDPGGTPEAAPDQQIDFTLSRMTHVRIETSGDAMGLGADFEHILGLMRRNGAFNPAEHQVVGTSNETLATAYPIPASDFVGGGWAHITGSVWNADTATLMRADYPRSAVGGIAGCGLRGGGADDSPDAVFTFSLDDTRTLSFDTENSTYRTFVSLHHARDLVSDNLNDTQTSAHELGTLNGRGWSVTGDSTEPTISRQYSPVERNASLVNGVRRPARSLACGANSSDMVFKFTLSQATDVQLDTLGSSFDTVLGLFDERGPDHFAIVSDAYDYPAALGCSDDADGSVTSKLIFNDLPAGTYYVVVAGWAGFAGDYTLNITDLRAPANDSMPLINCDSGSLPGDTERSRVIQTLGPGKYYVVLKGDETQVSPNYDYELSIREVGSNDVIACGYRNAGDPTVERGVIEEMLPAGDYTVVIRGAHASDAGSYRVVVRDADYLPTQVACHDTKLGDAASFSRALEARDAAGNPIDYWLVMRGFDANAARADNDPYSIHIRDASLGVPLDACTQLNLGAYTGVLEAGDYYAVVKGRTAADEGWYQLSMGDATLASAADYGDLASYAAARDALTTNGLRVIGAQLGSDASLTEQLSTLASDTLAVDVNNAPLVVQVAPNDPQLATSLGTQIVTAVGELTAGLHLSVGLRLDPAPSNPPKPFTFSARAVDTATDGCDAPVNQVHQHCEAGAKPQFSVTFANPGAPNDVPPNPADPNGGYYMTLEVVGNGRYVLERIPVYIVPSDVAVERAPLTYVTKGRYWQDLSSPNCLASEHPTWSHLSWDAILPAGTSLTWKMCGAETQSELRDCLPTTLATVTSGGACGQDSDCPHGFCAGNVCQFAEGPACDGDAACGVNGVCVDNTCRWTALPIDPAPALRGMGAGTFLRVRVDLQASSDRLSSPVIYDWHVDYECSPEE